MRGKFACESREGGEVVLKPVASEGGDTGEIILYGLSDETAAEFRPGREYYVGIVDAAHADQLPEVPKPGHPIAGLPDIEVEPHPDKPRPGR